MPPFGIKSDLAKLLIWIRILQRKDNLILYDNGNYISDWSVEIFDRFFKRPEFFSLEYFEPKIIKNKLTIINNYLYKLNNKPKNYNKVSIPLFLLPLFIL